MGSVLTKLCAPSMVQPRRNESQYLVSELTDSQLTAVFAGSQARSDSITTLIDTPTGHLGDFAIKRNTASRVLPRSSLSRDEVVMRFVHHATNVVQPLCLGFLVSGSPRCLWRGVLTESRQ